MPLIINQMPSGAIQFPVMPRNPSPAEINAMQAMAFMNRPDNSKERDLSAILALTQFIASQNNLDLEREIRRGDQDIRREELAALLGARKDETALRREEMAQLAGQFTSQLGLTRDQIAEQNRQFNANLKALTESQGKQYELARTGLENEAAARKSQHEVLLQELKNQGQMTGAQVEQIKAQVSAFQAIQRHSELNAAIASASGQFGAHAQTQEQIAGLDMQSQIEGEGRKYASAQFRTATEVPETFNRTAGMFLGGQEMSGGQLKEFEKSIRTTGDKFADMLSKAKDDTERAAIWSEYQARMAPLKLKASDPESFVGWNSIFDKAGSGLSEQISSAIREADRKVAPFASDRTFTGIQDFKAYLAERGTVAAKQRLAERSQREGAFQSGINQIRAGGGGAADVYKLLLSGTPGAAPAVPVRGPTSAPAPPLFDPAAPIPVGNPDIMLSTLQQFPQSAPWRY
jgi:hypothetical protein